jgi:hypothetical protein
MAQSVTFTEELKLIIILEVVQDKNEIDLRWRYGKLGKKLGSGRQPCSALSRGIIHTFETPTTGAQQLEPLATYMEPW